MGSQENCVCLMICLSYDDIDDCNSCNLEVSRRETDEDKWKTISVDCV